MKTLALLCVPHLIIHIYIYLIIHYAENTNIRRNLAFNLVYSGIFSWRFVLSWTIVTFLYCKHHFIRTFAQYRFRLVVYMFLKYNIERNISQVNIFHLLKRCYLQPWRRQCLLDFTALEISRSPALIHS